MNKTDSFRFEINLDVNNTENYEISLFDLMKPRDENLKLFNTDELDAMSTYVKQLEKKFGPLAVVKGKKIRVNDFIMQGVGYDVDDPFIDDAGTEEEAIVVAPDLMTQYGGFFVNHDTLKVTEPRFVIERLEGDDDISTLSKQHFQHKHNKMTKSQQLLSQAKKRLSTTKKPLGVSTTHTLDEVINDVVSTKVKKDVVNKNDNEHLKIAKKTEFPEIIPVVNKSPEKKDDVSVTSSTANPTIQKPIVLPADLPKNLKEKIQALIEMANKCKNDGLKLPNQCNVLLMEIDMILLSINSPKPVRIQVLRYISNAMDIKYESISRRISKVKESKKKQQHQLSLKCLQEAINEAMPDSLLKFDASTELYHTRVYQQQIESQTINIDLTGSQESAETKTKPPIKINHPKRLFKWTENCRLNLFSLVGDELDYLKNGKISAEEHLTRYFTSQIIGLWPAKWMTSIQLLKVCAPIIAEYKASIGKELNNNPPTIKSKTHKVKMSQNGPVTNKNKAQLTHVSPTKDSPVIPVKILVSPTRNNEKCETSNPKITYTVCQQLKTHLGNNFINECVKPLHIDPPKEKPNFIVNQAQPMKSRKSSPQPVQMISKVNQNMKLSPQFPSIIEKNIIVKEAVKRHSMDITSGPPMKTMILNQNDNNINTQPVQRIKEESLPYFYSHIYPKFNPVVQSPNTTTSADQQLHINHIQNSSNFTHSNQFPHLVNNVSPDNHLKIPNRQSTFSTIQSISTLLNPPIERQNIPAHLPPISKSTLNHYNLQQAQTIQRQYMGLQSDYDIPNVDINAHQISPDLYYNFNTAHFNNQRRFQN